jgi:hypothetical protein
MALMQKQGVDTVVRMHQRRRTDFRRGRILGIEDHIVTWTKPQTPPRRLGRKDFSVIPETLEIREIRYRVDVKGFRTQEITLATTLLDAQVYRPEDLADLYFQRWVVELDFRHIKITMQMDVLRCKTPQMVRKELWCHLLAYNLIRHLMWEAEQTNAGCTGRTSFKGTIQYLISFRAFFAVTTPQQNKALLTQFLAFVATQEIPHRPHRLEPRVKKRRPKKYNLMNKPRAELRAALIGG